MLALPPRSHTATVADSLKLPGSSPYLFSLQEVPVPEQLLNVGCMSLCQEEGKEEEGCEAQQMELGRSR